MDDDVNEWRLAKIRRICRRLGIKLTNKKSPNSDFVWTGRELYTIRGEAGTNTASTQDLCHEIAHWQVAAPSRRRYKDFYLPGMSIEYEEEELAVLLGVAWEIQLGADIESAVGDSGLLSLGGFKTYILTTAMRNPGSMWYVPEYVERRLYLEKSWVQLGTFLWIAMVAEQRGYLKNGKPTYHTNQGRPWTRTNSRSSSRSRTSSRTRAATAATRTSSRGKTSARAA